MNDGDLRGGRPGGVPRARRQMCPLHNRTSCSCRRNGEGKVLTMCGQCVGSGALRIPGTRDTVECFTCKGEGVR